MTRTYATLDPTTGYLDSTQVDPSLVGVDVTDGSTTVTGATEIDFTSGATVTDGGGGIAQIAITGGSGLTQPQVLARSLGA